MAAEEIEESHLITKLRFFSMAHNTKIMHYTNSKSMPFHPQQI
jgi:hypothetical protein